MASRTSNTSRNIVTGMANKITVLVLQFVSRKVFLVYIGIEYLGMNSLFSNILSLLSMADLGFGIAMAYSYYEPLAKKDYKKISALNHFYRKVYNIIALTVAVIGVVLIPFLKYIVNTDQPIDNLYLYYVLQLSNTVISYLFIYKSTILKADQKTYIANGIMIKVNVVKVIIQIIVMITLRLYLVYCICDVLATFINNLLISHQTDKRYPYIKAPEELDKTSKQDIFHNMSSVFLYKFSASIMGGTDSIIISVIVGTVAVGMYTNYLTITQQLINITNIIFTSFTASIGNLLVEGDKEKNYRVFKLMQTISFIISGIISICILALVEDLVAVWIGSEYIMGTEMTFAIALNTYFTISLQPIWSFREASGLYRKTKYIMVATAVLNIILSIILGLLFGTPGVVFATVLSRVLTYFWYEPKLVYDLYFGKNVFLYYIRHIINLAIIFGGYYICSFCWNSIGGEITGWLWLIRKTCFIGFIAVIIYVLAYFKNKDFRYILKKVCNLLRKKHKT